MHIILNGDEREVDDGISVLQLLEVLHIPTAGTAVARNDAVVRKALHAETILQPNDRIEILRAVAGG